MIKLSPKSYCLTVPILKLSLLVKSPVSVGTVILTVLFALPLNVPNDYYHIKDSKTIVDFIDNNYKKRLLYKKGEIIKSIPVDIKIKIQPF